MLCLLTSVVARQLDAQVLSGTLWRAADDTPAAGVLVVAEQVGDGRIVARTVTSTAGQYHLVLGAARVAVRALRVGFAPATLDTVQLSPGERRTLDARLEAVPIELRATRVVSDNRCTTPTGAADVLGQLLQQARTALLATNLPEFEQAFVTRAQVSRRSGSTLLTQRTLQTAGIGAFRGHGVDTVLRLGFLTERRDGSLEYRAPDVDVLLDDAFLADYCLTLGQDSVGRVGELGVHFRPARRRGGRVAIEGTLWLDARTASLRELDFTYVGADPIIVAAGAGGSLRFTELGNGLWFVHRWELRMPGVREATVVQRAGARPARVRAVTEVISAEGRVLSISAGGVPIYSAGSEAAVAPDGNVRPAPVSREAGACGRSGAGVISGRVTSAGESGRASLPFVEIEASWPHRAVEGVQTSVRRETADALGFFRFCDVPPDVPVRLFARARGHDDGQLLVRVESDEAEAVVELALRRQ